MRQEKRKPLGHSPSGSKEKDEISRKLYHLWEKISLVRTGEEKLRKDLGAAFHYLKGDYRKVAERLFTSTCSDKTRRMVLN